MTNHSELPTAIREAMRWHTNQIDKNNQPFIGHPLRVMAYVSQITKDDRILSAAVLHDVLEDTECTESHLLLAGLEKKTIELIRMLTRESGITYFDYIARIKGFGGPAIRIKLADLQDNLDPRRRFPGYESGEKKHLRARDILVEA